MYLDTHSKVLLPTWVFEWEEDENKTLELAEKYIRPRYKNYFIVEIKKPFAICGKVR